MTQRIPFSERSINKTIDHEQLNQIIEAILAGKYSWACFLLLRCTGYDPLHYIPYRTYNRLVKENCQSHNRYAEFSPNNVSTHRQLSKITDLDCLEVVNKQTTGLKGGNAGQEQELNSARFGSVLQKFRDLFRNN
jgi:hypothetical protein